MGQSRLFAFQHGGSIIEEPFVNSNRENTIFTCLRYQNCGLRENVLFTDGRLGQECVRTSRGNPPYHPGDPSHNQEPGKGSLMIRNRELFVRSPSLNQKAFSTMAFLVMNQIYDSWGNWTDPTLTPDRNNQKETHCHIVTEIYIQARKS